MSTTQPAIFLGHGSPMHAVQDNRYTRGWTAIGATLGRPSGVVCVSAHWYVPGVRVTAMRSPPTIHDFGGFPAELYAVEYPAPGDPALAARVAALLRPVPVLLDEEWGLDHGAWSVLCHVFPDASVPIVQLGIDRSKPPSFHYELAKRLAPLREEGVLLVGSGNIVHNLGAYQWDSTAPPFAWAERFEGRVRELLLAGDHRSLTSYASLGADARLAVPTPEHYLPLLYVIALQGADDPIGFPVEGFDGGSISMLSVRVG